MTYAEAHKFLEVKQRDMTQNRHLYNKTAITVNGKAIEAVEKQIPMEHHHTRIVKLKIDVRESVCPRCLGVIVTSEKEYPKHCTWCGQRIDWGKEKEE